MSTIRLQAALSKAGVAARRKTAELIESGHVKVNGKIVNRAGFRVDTAKDAITFDDKPVFFEKKEYYILNKPTGVLSTARDERGRKTILDCLRPGGARLYPVGRLDKNSTGLILLTNDGGLTYRLTHPKFGIKRVYEVKVKGAVCGENALRLKKGVTIDGKRARAEEVLFKNRAPHATVFTITLSEGRKREVRMMFEAIGHKVLKLKRIAYGPLRLTGLEEGAYRPLTRDEIVRLKHCVGIA